LYRNREGRLEDATSGAGLGGRTGWWNGIAGGDVDRDGDIDYVVTNFGLNTKYHASDRHPVKAYYGDMDGSGRSRFVEAEYEGETLFPVRGKSCSTAAVPMLGEKYEAFSQFAQASLQEIYTPKCLQEAHQFEINTLESGLWVNDGDGRFTFRPLPRIAQISPAFGVLLEEVNGDGHLDLYLVQNFFSAQAETGRMDGGVSLLLRGRGDGSFQPVWPNESGLLVEGDGKGASRVDLNQDGWTDFAVSQNDGAVRIFLNRGDPQNRMVRVQLRGSHGNPTGVGTRIKLESTDGSEQLREVYAGGSYLSQSSAAVHFGLGRKNRAATVEIRWPDGRVERRPVTEEGPLLTVDAPGENTGLVEGHSRRKGPSDQEIAKAYFQSGKVLAARGRWDEAERHYQGVMALRPQWADAQAGLGEVLRRSGRPEEAVVWLERAMNLEPENVAARFQLGRIHQAAGRGEIAKTHFEDVLASDPEHAGAHYHLAFLLEEEGELDASYDHFAGARSIDPGYGEETHFNFGRVHDARGRLALAWNHYRLALLTEPDDGETFNNLGSVCVRQGKIEEGISWLRKAVEHLENNAAVHQNLGTALLQLDRREEAAESYRRATELDADNYIAHTSLAFLLLKEGRKEAALHHYLNALRVKPDALASLNGAAWILATHEDESIRDAQRAVTLAAQACRLSQYRSPLLLDTLGAAYAASGDFDQAMRAMLKAIELDVAASGGKADEFRERLALYRQRKPYVEP
jgi:tetratricopeptide (TPR) repeat protein